MDFILKKLENRIALCDTGSYDYITYLRERIEYCLFLIVGYLWKNLSRIDQEKRELLIDNLKSLSIGHVVQMIKTLDIDKEILSEKSCRQLLDRYPAIRNSKIGHGYVMASNIASELIPFYDDLCTKITLIKEHYDLIVIKQGDEQCYHGFRFPWDRNGEGERWSCDKEAFRTDEKDFPRTYIFHQGKYIKISPFVFLDDHGLRYYVFSSMAEKLLGKVKMCRLLDNEAEEERLTFTFQELVSMCESDGTRQISHSNGTIMNIFQKNYSQYIDVGIGRLVEDFLKRNRSSVAATIWGHGGVGKTACIQYVCQKLFDETVKTFAYIIFVTAKDRIYNTKLGKIDEATGNVQRYNEVVEAISRILFGISQLNLDDTDSLAEYVRQIGEYDDRILIIIDDYETFEDSEKEKIAEFISSLDINHHKVIITTRNKRFVIGESIPSNELTLTQTKDFLQRVVEYEYPDHLESVRNLLQNEATMAKIQDATSGRPIFVYQFVHLYVQRGYKDELLSGLRESKDAREFLYGRIYNYLSTQAKDVFVTLSQVVSSDLLFRYDVLEHVLSKSIPDREILAAAQEELEKQRVIEQYNSVCGRIYSNEVLEIMEEYYKKCPSAFRHTIRNLLSSIGGKDIKGSVMEALLDEANRSRILGDNEQETMEKYRRVLNNEKCPYDIRKKALKNLSDYFANNRLAPQSAINVLEEYLPMFNGDPEIFIIYIMLLWSQGRSQDRQQERPQDEGRDKGNKKKANKEIRKFFAVEGRKKTNEKYLTLFALGVGYCISYDMDYHQYENDSLRERQLKETFNEYGKVLFNYVSKQASRDYPPATKHNIRVALVQTVQLCSELGRNETTDATINYGLKICAYLSEEIQAAPFANQVKRLQNGLKELLRTRFGKVEASPDSKHDQDQSDKKNVVPSWEMRISPYSVEEVVDVTVERFLPYGVIVKFGDSLSGLIHISEIACRFISNIGDEFEIGESCHAKIIRIERDTMKVFLSTKELGKFSFKQIV